MNDCKTFMFASSFYRIKMPHSPNWHGYFVALVVWETFKLLLMVESIFKSVLLHHGKFNTFERGAILERQSQSLMFLVHTTKEHG
jgi:hypothetical protein